MAIRVGMVSLGCAKNQVDGEMLMAALKKGGFETVEDAALADIAIVNTCGFIESAKKESIEEILELAPEPPVEPEPPKEPEPDYVMLNVMQRIVEDKIIYFMKQFDVCTCPRCKADTIALTLSGLPAKYKIVDKLRQ